MRIADAQREMRTRYRGGFYGQLVSGLLWLASAALATWSGTREAFVLLVVGGFFIFPVTELLLRATGTRAASRANSLRFLGMQVAFVLPLSMPLLLPVALYRLTLFYPALTILLGAHYVPFVFLYGMPMFAALAAMLIGGGLVAALHFPGALASCAWYTGLVLVAFAFVGWWLVRRERRAAPPTTRSHVFMAGRDEP
jgi:hypothetical protein